jgi:hypothetical protein
MFSVTPAQAVLLRLYFVVLHSVSPLLPEVDPAALFRRNGAHMQADTPSTYKC